MTETMVRLTPAPVREFLSDARALSERRDVRRAFLVLAVVLAVGAYVREILPIYLGDAHMYWTTFRTTPVYFTAPSDAPHGFLYAPAFLQVMAPLLALPWEIFYGIWLALMILTVLWMARPALACVLFLTVFITFGIEPVTATRHALSSGNVALFMGLAVAASFRWPSAWALLLLTKVTPGICLIWFVVRGEWRNLAIALGTTAAIAAVSFAIAPSLWADWFTVLKNNSGYPEPPFAYHILPLIPRLVIAGVITVVGARFNARWVVGIAAALAMPYIWTAGLVMFLAVVPLLRNDAWTRSSSKPTPATAQRLTAAPASAG